MSTLARPRLVQRTIRSKLLLIILFLGVGSTAVGVCITIIYLNVVLRRESAYIIEEHINAIIDYAWKPNEALPRNSDRRSVLPLGNPEPTATPAQAHRTQRPSWLSSNDFVGLVLDQDRLVVRWVTHSKSLYGVEETLVLDRPINPRFLAASGAAAGLTLIDFQLVTLFEYRQAEGLWGEITANFIPGSGRPVPVIVTARDWSTGKLSDFVICRVSLNYKHTLNDLSRMGLRRASWLAPLLSSSATLALIYLLVITFCIRLGGKIVKAANELTSAAQRVGRGDLSVRVSIDDEDQLGELGERFNDMVRSLASLREKENEAVLLHADISLASEVQAYLTRTKPTHLRGATVWSTSTPARRVSGDLHEIITFSETKAALVCADVSGKGVSSALVMAQIQGFLHAYLCGRGEPQSPAELARLLNNELCQRLPISRYATFFYGEIDLCTRTLRYVNAGHASPLVITNSQAHFVREGDMPIGLFPKATFREQVLQLDADSTVVIYTDGVTDALNRDEEQLGEDGLLAFCSGFPGRRNAAALGQALRHHVLMWSDDKEQFDDVTLVVLSMSPAEA